MIQKLVAGALVALVLGACAFVKPEEKLPPQAEAPGVQLTKQQGGRFIAFVGPRRQHAAEFLDVSDTNYFTLRSWYDNKTGEAAHQLYVADSYYGGPFRWDGVHDADNTALKFIPISRNQISCDQGCSYADEFAAELQEDYLRSHKGGLAIVFTSSDGKNLPINVPGDFVTAQLAAVDTVRAIAAKANAAPPPTAAAGSPEPQVAPAQAASPTPAASPLPPTPPTPPAAAPGTVVPAPPNSR